LRAGDTGKKEGGSGVSVWEGKGAGGPGTHGDSGTVPTGMGGVAAHVARRAADSRRGSGEGD
jgi:hypothetical protein